MVNSRAVEPVATARQGDYERVNLAQVVHHDTDHLASLEK